MTRSAIPIGGLYRPQFEKDSCGFGLIAQMDREESHGLVETAIKSLGRLTHRGAVAADGKTGDGCGILLNKPDAYMRSLGDTLGFAPGEHYAVGMIFLSVDDHKAHIARTELEAVLRGENLQVLGWREVPTDTSALGDEASESCPRIEQVFVNSADEISESQFERRLFVARRRAEKKQSGQDDTFYVCSLSGRVISYKGLMMPENLPVFFPELNDAEFKSSLCVFHQRFSTNTWPQWRLCQPFRFLAHNGEINTIQGNRHWAQARSYKFASPFLDDMDAIRPFLSNDDSDSCSLDNMLEVLVAGGMDIFRAMQILIPPAWQNVETMDQDLRAFHRFHSMHMEPWDGPAGIVLTDGRYAACAMDRNGLRPARYVVTRDRHITVASEIGVYDYAQQDVIEKGRLRPGQMIAADTHTGELLLPEEIERRLQIRKPYKQWLKKHQVRLHANLSEDDERIAPLNPSSLLVYQKLFNVTFEERDQVIRVLAQAGQEAVGSMGDDTPQPVLSARIRSLYDYFRQQFAQVTNPPIDPLRERIVMALETCFGREQNIFEETEEHAARVVVDSPVLSNDKLNRLLALDDKRYASATIDLCYPNSGQLSNALGSICDQAIESVRSGKTILVLTDRNVAKDQLPVHALLATGAVHHRLIAEGLRCNANIVVETATARDPHHFAVLLGYGATAINPYLAYEIIYDMIRVGEVKNTDAASVLRSYRQGIGKGLYKIISKMGISTIASYRGAQLFEAVGLHDEVVDYCFAGTVSRVQGTRFQDIETDQRTLTDDAWNPRKKLSQGGMLKYIHGGEYHAYNPDVIRAVHEAVASGDYAKYKEFSELIHTRPVTVMRDLLRLKSDRRSIPIEQVEPIEEILPRFDSAGMSLGALSPEAHETLAQAMNTIGGRSNSGEGGEDPRRYGTNKMSKIKQVASGRFGVTPAYLVNAEVLQIKVAQGAKPGEGGQLPGHKVNDLIATLRYSKPGVALISPPPHHDIYSIEDLAQLIFDLKQVNPDALVSVKLVAEAGVGTIAAGVAKAYADLITIAGYDGGTGASPLTSVKNAGIPWELGLTETRQALCANNLRAKVRVQVDGGFKTGLDVIKGAILGAESFGFGTMPMVALGCKYLRICHLNNCATGVATQHATLRKRHFIGTAERVINYFTFVATEVREYLAQLGFERLEDLIGHTELLEVMQGQTDRQRQLNLQPLLSKAGVPQDSPQYCVSESNRPNDKGVLAERMVQDILPVIESGSGGEFSYPIKNVNRSIGARLSGEIARRFGNTDMEQTPVTVRLTGTAGQSFGVWNAGGLNLVLEGDANDYVGKGMAGGKLVVYPSAQCEIESQDSAIIGNTCLYGATGGKLFAAGRAGERFAVRNSGAHAIIEGCGDHACEYMTGGVVAVLGSTGINFGAGMTGGLAFVLDLDRNFVDCYNHELIDIHRVTPEAMEAHLNFLRQLIDEFIDETGSQWGKTVRDDLLDLVGRFWLVKPKASDLESLLGALLQAA